MSEIVKGVLGGTWTLFVSWLFPAGLTLALFGILVLPSLTAWPLAADISAAESGTKALILASAALVFGLVLSSLQTPMYRLLEGYLFWPQWLRELRRRRHQTILTNLLEELEEAPRNQENEEADRRTDLDRALKSERVRRYPNDRSEVAPTLLGNAIRRFETYAFDRYRLDSQLLWSQLRAVAPEAASKQTDDARAGVDFFICLLFSQLILAISATAALAFAPFGETTRLVFTAASGVIIAIVCYRLAVTATDSWAAAVRCLVDTGRSPLAKVYGLTPPPEFEQEREMWRGVNWLVLLPYEKEAGSYLDQWRRAPSAGSGSTSKGIDRTDTTGEPPQGTPIL